MLKYLIGTAFGAAMAFAFAAFDMEPPAVVTAPARFKANLVVDAVASELYGLSGNAAARQRALEVYFKNRARDAAELDGRNGHPFLNALMRERAAREAGELLAAFDGYDVALAQPALKARLAAKHGVSDGDNSALKLAMLGDALDAKPFLKAWLVQNAAAGADDLHARLQLAADVHHQPANPPP